MCEEIILDFINKFKSYHKTEIEDVFSNGYCYWFAYMLNGRFGGDIVYDPIQNHFALLKDGKIYDINGLCSGSFELWYKYISKDELETKRIFRDCIYKEDYYEE